MLLTMLALLGLIAALIRDLHNGPFAVHFIMAAFIAWLLEQKFGLRYEPFSYDAVIATGWLHLTLINVSTFAAYAYDKHAARKGRWRVSERALHAFAIIGGIGGAYLGQKLLRHKTRKRQFRSHFLLIFTLQLFVLLGLVLFTLAQ